MSSDKNEPLLKMISVQKLGIPIGIYSICSANRFVLQAAVRKAGIDETNVLIEATSNQVDQFGGYTGMTPEQFTAYAGEIAVEAGFPVERVILGGDHLGPNAWRNEDAHTAMSKARDLIHDYVAAGFTKIHLDASMSCADDRLPFADEIIAARSAELCGIAESTHAEKTGLAAPVYVIGTEVPTPGGAQEEISGIEITASQDVDRIISLTRDAFLASGLHSAWKRVIAVVVQPGVEFGVHSVVDYDREKTVKLSQKIESYDNLVYEAHSTDYQTVDALKKMVEDHFAILKVGPWLTFAFREAVFALAHIEREWLATRKGIQLSNILDVIETVMCEDPKYWEKYYHGNDAGMSFARKYSFSDRIRYYWPYPKIQQALVVMMKNLSIQSIPLSLLSQYLPVQFDAVRERRIQNTPADLIREKITDVIDKYSFACGTSKG